MSTLVGKIVKSNSHTDYICQIYGLSEVEVPPSPVDCLWHLRPHPTGLVQRATWSA